RRRHDHPGNCQSPAPGTRAQMTARRRLVRFPTLSTTASSRLYLLLILCMVPFILSVFLPAAAQLGLAFDIVVLIAAIIDLQLTTRKSLLSIERQVEDRLSIGRDNEVKISIAHGGTAGGKALKCRLKDDTPAQIKKDVSLFQFDLAPGSTA